MIGYCDQAQGSNRSFYQHYRSVGGHNGHFDFPDGPNHDWGTWSGQLGAMSGDLAATIKYVRSRPPRPRQDSLYLGGAQHPDRRHAGLATFFVCGATAWYVA